MSEHLDDQSEELPPEGRGKKLRSRFWALTFRVLRLSLFCVAAGVVYLYAMQAIGQMNTIVGPLACEQNLRDLSSVVESFALDHQGTPPAKLEDLIPDYLIDVPACPGAGRPTYQISTGYFAPFNNEQDPNYYYLNCFGLHHQDHGLSYDFPGYSKTHKIVYKHRR